MIKRVPTLALLAAASAVHAAEVYSNLPRPLPNAYLGLRYNSMATSEFGNRVHLGGTERQLSGITVGMSSWALGGAATTFDQAMTINVYGTGSGERPGALLASKTQSFAMPYRTAGAESGATFLATFDLASLGVALPDDVVVGLAFGTQNNAVGGTLGAGPWNSLAFGLVPTATSVGADLDADDVMWNTSKAGLYADGGAGGVGVFRRDTSWSGFAPAMSVQAVPEPASLAVLALGGLSVLRRRRSGVGAGR